MEDAPTVELLRGVDVVVRVESGVNDAHADDVDDGVAVGEVEALGAVLRVAHPLEVGVELAETDDVAPALTLVVNVGE